MVRGRKFLSMLNTWPNYLNLFKTNASSEYLTLKPSTFLGCSGDFLAVVWQYYEEIDTQTSTVRLCYEAV